MDIKNTSGVLESLLGKSKPVSATRVGNSTSGTKQRASTSLDVVNVTNNTSNAVRSNASKLISENIEKIDNGFRRVQEFETAKGQKFTRIEEVTTTAEQSKRLVVQQNESGSISISENILDRQDNGSFRKTERFTNEIGETDTNIEFNVASDNASQLLGLPPSPTDKPRQPFEPLRGTQYDVRV